MKQQLINTKNKQKSKTKEKQKNNQTPADDEAHINNHSSFSIQQSRRYWAAREYDEQYYKYYEQFTKHEQ